MKTLELSKAKASLNDYARSARGESLLLTVKGRPYATLTPVGPHTDMENLTVTTDPRFVEMMERSERRWREEGGLSSDEVRAQLRIGKRRPARRAVASGRRASTKRRSSGARADARARAQSERRFAEILATSRAQVRSGRVFTSDELRKHFGIPKKTNQGAKTRTARPTRPARASRGKTR